MSISSISGIDAATRMRLEALTRDGVQGLTADIGPSASFRDLLLQSIDQVNTMQQDADVAVETLLTGGDINPAEVLTAVQKADMAFKMMQQIRNKLLDAYREIQEIRI
ncbi:MAG TPA: flagellar hook-basal body complex protein FliE [Planctomycetaceae bacterium]|nr:flagellar hook-basal body complex protein FliE [Planctomycetaceae bacterium]HRE98920.1 flagellar hook-basal body complex protein FliE [Pirellulaceae bacterium]